MRRPEQPADALELPITTSAVSHMPALIALAATVVADAPLAPCMETPVAKVGLMSMYSAIIAGAAPPSVTRPLMSCLRSPASAIASLAASAHRPYSVRPSSSRRVGTSPIPTIATFASESHAS